MASYSALNNNSNTYLGPDPSSPSPIPGTTNATTTGNNPSEVNSLLEHIDGINFGEPLTPPNPNRFSTFSPSIGTSNGNGSGSGIQSTRDSYVSDSNSAAPISAAAGGIAGAGAGAAIGSFGSRGSSSVPSGGSKEHFYNTAAVGTGAVGVAGGAGPASGKSRRFWWVVAGITALIIAAAVAIPVGLIIGRRGDAQNRTAQTPSSADGNNGSDSNGGDNTPPVVAITTGGDGSTVTTEDGETFTYRNSLGGYWVWDPEDPYNNGAKPNEWTPALNESWRWGQDKIYGVNLGGLFVLEPFIVPAPFQKYRDTTLSSGIDVVDEWTLSQAMALDTSPDGGLSQLEDHYNTFITEQDIAEIAGAGLNWVRLPIPFWAIDEWDNEPFLAHTCWKYILRVFRWCRKYGIRVKLDVHTVPGSQNGYNHSGKLGQINFLRGVMGLANAQRMLGYIRIIAEFVSQPEYKDLVQIFGIMNEPRSQDIGIDVLSQVYLQAYDVIREVTGIGEGNGPWISFHDGFVGPGQWEGFLTGADRIIIDWHPYFAFNGAPNTEPIGEWIARPCRWGSMTNDSQSTFGVTVAGEFSNAINDCGLFLNGVPGSSGYGGDCGDWEDASLWDQTIVDGLKQFALSSFDALQNYFFWTWKIGNATSGHVEAPLWSYKLGLEGGWMPLDPREAKGQCARLGSAGPQFDDTFLPQQTGGPGSGNIDAAQRALYGEWPPSSMRGVEDGGMDLVPTYTATGSVNTLPPDTFTVSATDGAVSTITISGDGWTNDEDRSGGVTEVAGCDYPDPWDSAVQTMPTATCTGRAAVRFARRTPAPVV